MKLILANNQSAKFRQFYQELSSKSQESFEYAGYESLLFEFDTTAVQPVVVRNLASSTGLGDYSGVYLNGYLHTYELAAATATCCQALAVPFVNRELADAPSLSKLTAYAKLAAAGVSLPRSLAGSKTALLGAEQAAEAIGFPLVLKRADADRGVDNYKVSTWAEVQKFLEPHEPRSLWLLQEFVANDGFYLVSFYDQQPAFCIFRSLEKRPDGDASKAHMFKPKGGANASLIDLPDVPAAIIATCQRAVDALNRQIGSVDCLYDRASGRVHVLEVNYNPQLVTITTFKDTRLQAFLDGISKIG